MTCNEVMENISLFLERDLEKEKIIEIEFHLKKCEKCNGKVELMQKILSNSKKIFVPTMSNMLTLKIKKAINNSLQINKKKEFNPIMNVEELANYLNVRKKDIEDILFELPHFYIGNNLRFKKDSIDLWIKSKEKENFPLNLTKKII